MATGSKSQELIKQLLDAEKQAEEIIANAKKNRLTKLRQAKEKAEEDLKVFREEQEAKFQKEAGSRSNADATLELKTSTKTELELVEKDYVSNKGRTVDYVAKKVLDVPVTLTETQIRALKMGIV
mmetsp:Transcript_29385/g.63901  ORF Transcript_29385/g.63901 Transcript_29385/m.63901 type:complete len:125 (+) Transcript_29385:84-458(+)